MAEELTACEKLTPRQRLFVDFFLGEARLNATKAARLAGYLKPRDSGYQLLRKTPGVQAAIEERLKENTLSANAVLSEITDIARGNIADFITVGGSDLSPEAEQLIAKAMTDLDLMLQEIRGEGGLPTGLPERIEQKREEIQALAEQIRQMTHTRPWVFDLEKAEREGVLHLIAEIGTTEKGATKLKLASRLEALKLLGQFHNLWKEKTEVNVTVNPFEGWSDEDLEAYAAGRKSAGAAPSSGGAAGAGETPA